MLETDSAPQEDTTTYDDDLQKIKEESDKHQSSMKSTFEGIYYFQLCYCILYSAGQRKWILEDSPSVSNI